MVSDKLDLQWKETLIMLLYLLSVWFLNTISFKNSNMVKNIKKSFSMYAFDFQ